MSTVNRSRGLPTGHLGLMAGAGYSGITPTLDTLIAEAAEALRMAYNRDVMIRFNTDRRFGGAWLVTHVLDRFRGNAEIGICAGYVPADIVAMRLACETDDRIVIDAVPRALRLFAHIGTASLRNPKNTVQWYSTAGNLPSNEQYTHLMVADIPDALRYLQANAILREKY